MAARKRDKGVLMSELVRLRQQQQQTDAAVRLMQRRLAATEQQHTQMLGFLSSALHRPALLQQLVTSGMPQMREDPTSPGTTTTWACAAPIFSVPDFYQRSFKRSIKLDAESGLMTSVSDKVSAELPTSIVWHHKLSLATRFDRIYLRVGRQQAGEAPLHAVPGRPTSARARGCAPLDSHHPVSKHSPAECCGCF